MSTPKKKVTQARGGYYAAGSIYPVVGAHVEEGDPVWKLALDCGHVIISRAESVIGTPAPPHYAPCPTCDTPHPEREAAPARSVPVPLSDPGPSARLAFQRLVADWCERAFGATHAQSVPQRALRLLEEAIEAYQAAGAEREMAHKLVDFVFDRPPGELRQELGGVGVTVLALASAAGLDAEACEAAEIARVLALDVEVVRARNAAKDAAGFTVKR